MLPTRPSSPIDFEQIYRDYHKNVYNYIYGQILHREAAEDLTADVFVAVATHLGQFDPARGSLTAWIFTIARNLTQNYRLRASTRMEESCGPPKISGRSAFWQSSLERNADSWSFAMCWDFPTNRSGALPGRRRPPSAKNIIAFWRNAEK